MRGKKALLNIGSTLLLNIISIVIGFIVPKLIIGSYGSDVNGLTSSITQFLAYISLLEVGIGPIIISMLYKPIAEKDKGKIEQILATSQKFFRKIAYVFIIYLVVLLVVYPLFVKDEFDYIFTLALILILSVSTFFEYFFGMTNKLLLESLQKKYIINIINIVTSILNCVAIVILINCNFSIHIVKLISSLIYVSRPIIMNIYIKKKYNFKVNKDTEEIKIENKKEGFSIHVSGIIFSKVDTMLLTLFADIKYVSVYAIYNLIITGINNILLSFTKGISASFGDMIAKSEKENLNKKFRSFETFYMMILTVIISCLICLIIPFIKVYTAGITDVNYVQNTFAIILCISTFFYLLKSPYATLLCAGGYFKEMNIGGWVEAILNIVISLALIFKYNIVGVAIGTAISVFVRMIELIIIVNKKVLKNSAFISINKLILAICIIAINYLLYRTFFINIIEVTSYMTFFVKGIMLAVIFMIVSLIVCYLLYKKDLIDIKKMGVGVIKK